MYKLLILKKYNLLTKVKMLKEMKNMILSKVLLLKSRIKLLK